MKIIDKTPLLNEKGELGPVQRVQGMFQFGFNWPNELQAQSAIVKFFDRQLEKGYTLIRNVTLGASGIMVPIILLGPAGIFVIDIAYMRGRYEAKGNSWNEASGNQYKPASINLIQRTARMGRAVKAFIERQGIKLPVKIEPVLIAGDPGLHIELVRPAIRVMMIDGVKSFVSGLVTSSPVLSVQAAHDFADHIVNPRPPRKESAMASTPSLEPQQPVDEAAQKEVSRARAIFNAAEAAKPFDPADFDFSMMDESAEMESNADSPASEQPTKKVPTPPTRILGMTPVQIIVVLFLLLLLVGLLAAFAYLYFFVF